MEPLKTQFVPTIRTAFAELVHTLTGGVARTQLRIHSDLKTLLSKHNQQVQWMNEMDRSFYEFRHNHTEYIAGLHMRIRKLELAAAERQKREVKAVSDAIKLGGEVIDKQRDDEETSILLTERDLKR